MTAQRSLKQRIRERMKVTGETYSTARREVLQQKAQTIDVTVIATMDGWTITGKLRDEAQGVTVEQIKQMLRELPGRQLTDTTITFDDMTEIVAALKETIEDEHK